MRLSHKAILKHIKEDLEIGKPSIYTSSGGRPVALSINKRYEQTISASIRSGKFVLLALEQTHGSVRLPQPFGEYISMEVDYALVDFVIDLDETEGMINFTSKPQTRQARYYDQWENYDGVNVELNYAGYELFSQKVCFSKNQCSRTNLRSIQPRLLPNDKYVELYWKYDTVLKSYELKFQVSFDNFLCIVHGKKDRIIPCSDREENVKLQSTIIFDYTSLGVCRVMDHLKYLSKLSKLPGHKMKFLPQQYFVPFCYLETDWSEFLTIINAACTVLFECPWRLTEMRIEQGDGARLKIVWLEDEACSSDDCKSSSQLQKEQLLDTNSTDLIMYDHNCLFFSAANLWPSFTDIPINIGSSHSRKASNWLPFIGWGRSPPNPEEQKSQLQAPPPIPQEREWLKATFPNLSKNNKLGRLLSRPCNMDRLAKEERNIIIFPYVESDQYRKDRSSCVLWPLSRSKKPKVIGEGNIIRTVPPHLTE